jgi:septum formation inhibitor MinC
MKIGQLEQLRQKIKTLKAQAANDAVVIEMKTISMKHDLAKLDIDAILQAARSLHTTVTTLREATAQADDLNAELYD